MKFLSVRLCRYIWNFMNTHCKSIIYCIAYEHTCIIPHFAAEAHPPVFVMLTGRMRKDKKQKDAAEQQALLFYTHTHTHAGTRRHIPPEIFWRCINVSLQHTHQSWADLRRHHSASCLCASVCVCLWAVKGKRRTAECEVDADIFVLSLFYVCMFMPQLISYLTFTAFLVHSELKAHYVVVS